MPTSVSATTITDLTVGSGAIASTGSQVTVLYVGKLDDGTVFERSPTPFIFQLGHGMVINGWETGLVGMRVGGKRKLIIPPQDAYGARGAPPKIPPNATLTFEIELLAAK